MGGTKNHPTRIYVNGPTHISCMTSDFATKRRLRLEPLCVSLQGVTRAKAWELGSPRRYAPWVRFLQHEIGTP